MLLFYWVSCFVVTRVTHCKHTGLFSTNLISDTTRFGEGFGPPNPSNKTDAEIVEYIRELFRKQNVLNILQNDEISIITRAIYAEVYFKDREDRSGMAVNLSKGGLYDDWGKDI